MSDNDKQCSQCGVTKPLSAFSIRSKSCGDLRQQCRDCVNAKRRELRARKAKALQRADEPTVHPLEDQLAEIQAFADKLKPKSKEPSFNYGEQLQRAFEITDAAFARADAYEKKRRAEKEYQKLLGLTNQINELTRNNNNDN